MKKLLSAILAFLMVLSCAAIFSCGKKGASGGTKNEGEIYGMYSAAVEKTNNLKSFVSKIESEQTISIDLGGGSTVETSTTTTGTSKLKFAEDGTALSETHGVTTTDAYSETQEVEFDLFSDRDNYYYRQGGSGDYTVMPKTGEDAQAVAAALGSIENQKIEMFGKDDIDRVTVTAEDESGTTLKMVIKGKNYNDRIDELLGDLISSYETMGAKITRCEVTSDPVCEYTISPEGYISKVALSFEMEMEMELSGITMEMKLVQDSVTEITDPDGEVEIVFPDAG
ncbi:MAG: hypothetical protein IKR53_05315 [Clostridia bacterium]|nr:hypothetical protein [Clostridia bacterium]